MTIHHSPMKNVLMRLVCRLQHSRFFRCLNLSLNEHNFPSVAFVISFRRLDCQFQKWPRAFKNGGCNGLCNALAPLRTSYQSSIRSASGIFYKKSTKDRSLICLSKLDRMSQEDYTLSHRLGRCQC